MSKYDSDSRNNSYEPVSKKGNKLNIIEKEVQNLFSSDSGNITTTKLGKLRQKYQDDRVVDDIYDAYYSQLQKIRELADTFAKKFLKHYQGLPLHKGLKTALKYKHKYRMTDAEFREFQRIYQQKLVGHKDKLPYRVERTVIGKTLGDVPSAEAEPLRVSPKDEQTLKEILRLYHHTRMLHSQVMIQSITYRDCAPEALTGQLYQNNRMINHPSNHVHPVVAALFLPKVQILDEHMLFANIAHIVKCKHENKPIMTKPDYELYYDLVTDPNDVVCNVRSPLKDLLNRSILQKDLWDAVLHLRNGKYYEHNLANFLTAIDNCRINMYDAPDQVYFKDEGALIRRILSAFSLRPTIVTTLPLTTLTSISDPYARPPTMGQVTAIPMVKLTLPLETNLNQNQVVDLQSSLNQAQLFMENNTIVAKHQAIIYSRGVLFFYVNRRFQSINVANMLHPYNFKSLPMTTSGFEKVNTKSVNFQFDMTIMTERYNLRSVVYVTCSKSGPTKGLITGTSTLVMKHGTVGDDQFYEYNPQRAGIQHEGTNPYPPVVAVTGTRVPGNNSLHPTFSELASKYGTVFMYEKVDSGRSQNPFYRTN
jgi:hypothetical protein